jgi:carbohydrate diacid regulator
MLSKAAAPRSQARRAAALLRERHGVVVHIGIGESGSGVAALADSCADAKAALQLTGQGTGVEIREISQLRVRQLLDSTSNGARARFTRSQLARLSGENDFPVRGKRSWLGANAASIS